MTTYTFNIDALNAIAVLMGGSGGHSLNIDASNEIAGLLGGSGGHVFSVDALGEIAGLPAGSASSPAVVTVIDTNASALQNNIFATNLVERDGAIYVGYMETDRTPWIAKSTDGGSTWSAAQVSATAAPDDAHCTTTIGIDRNGYIHCFYGMHNVPIKYSRSTNPNDISAWTAVNRVISTTGEGSVTYPQLYVSPLDGQLLFAWREGVSNAGQIYHAVYDETSQTWSRLGGASGATIDGDPTSRGPYVNTLAMDASGNVYATFTFRENTTPANENIYFAKFNKATSQWQKSDGTVYTLPITQTTAELVVNTSGKRLINQGTSLYTGGAFYSANVFDASDVMSEVHISKLSGGTWTTVQASDLSKAKVELKWPDISRPTLMEEGGVLYFIVSDGATSSAVNFQNNPGDSYLYKSSDGGATWAGPIPAVLSSKVAEYTLDIDRWQRTGEAWLFGQAVGAATGPCYLVPLSALKAAPAATGTWRPTDEATLVAWYDLLDGSTLFADTAGTTAATSAVARVNDKGPNGYHVTQATAANQPTLSSGVVSFDGTNDALVSSASFAQPGLWSGVGAGKPTDFLATRMMFNADNTGARHAQYLTMGSTPDLRATGFNTGGTAFTATGGTATANTPILLSSRRGSTSIAIHKNGQQVAESLATGTPATITTTLRLANRSAEYWKGPLYGAILFSTDDARVRQKAEGYLAHRVAAVLGDTTLVDALPTWHPYKATAP